MVQDEAKIVPEKDELHEQPELEMENTAKGIESGKYKLVGWAIDTTGRRLIDEICQIAVYSPDSEFSQYIMPFGDVPYVYGQIHNIRVTNVGRYRMLKDSRTNKIIKTKSDVTALTEFIEWLEKSQGDFSDGIILIFHEFHKWTPPMLIEILRKHLLLERFSKVVKGFANSFALCRSRCATTTKSFKLHVMTQVLLGRDNDDLSSASLRARACYDLVAHLGAGERTDLVVVDTAARAAGGDSEAVVGVGEAGVGVRVEELVEMVRPYTNPVEAEEDEIKAFKILLARQNTFKPVFSAHLRASSVERQRASHLRRLLAYNNIELNMLKEAWDKNKREELESVIKAGVSDIVEADLAELLDIFDSFFDPDKKQILPKKRFYDNNNRRFRTGKYLPRSHTKSESEDKSKRTSTSEGEVVPVPEAAAQATSGPDEVNGHCSKETEVQEKEANGAVKPKSPRKSPKASPKVSEVKAEKTEEVTEAKDESEEAAPIVEPVA